MEIVALEAPNEDLHQTSFPHLLLDSRIRADVEEYIEADEEQFVLLPNEDVQNL